MDERSHIIRNTTQQQQQPPTTLDVSSADCIRLILAHLTENGLHETARTLQRESGIGLAGARPSGHWRPQAAAGQWAAVLRGLAVLDRDRSRLAPALLAGVHEMAVLECAEAGDWRTAYAVFRLLQRDESLANAPSALAMESGSGSNSKSSTTITVSRSLEQKLAALAAATERPSQDAPPIAAAVLPDDYYGTSSTKQARRDELGRQLQEAVPQQPPQRLLTLLQQAIKWQSYTGQLPQIRQWWTTEEEEGEKETAEEQTKDDNDKLSSTKKKKKQKRKRKEFDLVLGEVSVDPLTVGDDPTGAIRLPKGKYVTEDYATISFGKKATCESAVFLPNAVNPGLVTGSSDGLIEIWDTKKGQLRTDDDFKYQANDELMGHDSGAAVTALAVSNDGQLLASGAADGTVHLWRLDTGKCLRTIETSAAQSGVACLHFSPQGSQLLTASRDGTCREFGLRTARMLKEFRGHTAYLTGCFYQLVAATVVDDPSQQQQQLVVVTSSGDGSVRLWNGTTTDCLRVFQPVSLIGRDHHRLSARGASIVTSGTDRGASSSGADGDGTTSPAIHSVHPLHTPHDSLIVVPRGVRAFLVDYSGTVLQTFQDTTTTANTAATDKVFVASTVSSTNRWLYAVRDDGSCCIFDVTTGELEHTILDFGSHSTSSSSAEVSCLIHHGSKDMLAAFSNRKGQKKGKLVLWK